MQHEAARTVPARWVARRVDELVSALDSTAPFLIAGLFGIGVLLVLSFVPWGQNADDLLPTIMSLQKITLYFWEQNRFGNLLPALTAWIADPTQNAWAQIVLRVAAGMVAPLFFTAMIFPRASDAWRAALAADGLLLWAGDPALLREIFLVASPYGTSLACGGLAMLALGHAWRRPLGCRLECPLGWQRGAWAAAGSVGLLAAHVVNYALAMVAIPMLGLFAVLLPSAARMRVLVLNGGAALVAFALPAAFAPYYPTPMGMHLSWEGLGRFQSAIWGSTGWVFAVAAVAPVVLALVAFRFGAVKRSAKPFAVSLLAGAATAVVSFVLIAASEHVRLNQYHPRYFLPILMLVLAVGGVAVWQVLRLMTPARIVRNALFMVVAVLMLMGARGHLMASGDRTPDIVGFGKADLARSVAIRYGVLSLDAIAGDYWDVWPSVFMTEQYHRDTGWTGADVLGVAHRSRARRDVFLARLFARGRLRLVCIDMEPEACVRYAVIAMAVPGLRGQAFAPSEAVGGGHTLYYVEIAPPPLSPP